MVPPFIGFAKNSVNCGVRVSFIQLVYWTNWINIIECGVRVPFIQLVHWLFCILHSVWFIFFESNRQMLQDAEYSTGPAEVFNANRKSWTSECLSSFSGQKYRCETGHPAICPWGLQQSSQFTVTLHCNAFLPATEQCLVSRAFLPSDHIQVWKFRKYNGTKKSQVQLACSLLWVEIEFSDFAFIKYTRGSVMTNATRLRAPKHYV